MSPKLSQGSGKAERESGLEEMIEHIERVRGYLRERDSAAALKLIDELLTRQALSPRLLVLKAQCLALSDEPHSLSETQSLLQTAVGIDDEYVDAYIVLGWHHLNVLDDARTAKSEFGRALELLRRLNLEVIRGLLACSEELEPAENHSSIEMHLREALLPPNEDGTA